MPVENCPPKRCQRVGESSTEKRLWWARREEHKSWPVRAQPALLPAQAAPGMGFTQGGGGRAGRAQQHPLSSSSQSLIPAINILSKLMRSRRRMQLLQTSN